ncbi:nucleoside deaminase [Candidatus Saccharibacteria bacterium]|nr:nucleoside deaminase [Candidatus Saccharibacteria bacterium]
MNDRAYLEKAIELSRESVERGGFPAGAIVVKESKILASGVSSGNQLNDPTSHAEIEAIRKACHQLKTTDLSDTTMYSSMEPCLMCYGATEWSNIPRVVYACAREKLSQQHFEGDHNLAEINRQSLRPVELVHLQELEQLALGVVEDWEKAK